MYAVIKTGGKQYRVATGDVIEVEHLRRAGDDETLTLTPLLVVTDDGKTLHGTKALSDFQVGAKVVGEAKGDKIKVFKYRNKTGYARKTGHRQLYSRIEITSIGDGAAGSKASSAKAPATKAPAKKAPAEEASAGKASAKKAPAEKASAGKSTEEKATAKKSPTKKASAKTAEPATKSEPESGGKSAETEPGNVSSDGS